MQILNYYERPAEDSPFEILYVDITHRCNMACANCYLPNRHIPDMPIEPLFQTIAKLPRKTELRLIGGEPTLVRNLPEIIRKIKSLGHRPALITNGLKLADANYCKLLVEAGLRDVCISMNGGDDDSIYEVTDNMKCGHLKMSALKNVLAFPKVRLSLGCIVIRGLNEHIPYFLYQQLRLHNGYYFINIRNVGDLGRHMTGIKNYSFEELIDLVKRTFHLSNENMAQLSKNAKTNEHQIFFTTDRNKKTRGVWIKITDWNPPGELVPDPNSEKRGRVTPDFKVAPFFEHVKMNEFNY